MQQLQAVAAQHTDTQRVLARKEAECAERARDVEGLQDELQESKNLHQEAGVCVCARAHTHTCASTASKRETACR